MDVHARPGLGQYGRPHVVWLKQAGDNPGRRNSNDLHVRSCAAPPLSVSPCLPPFHRAGIAWRAPTRDNPEDLSNLAITDAGVYPDGRINGKPLRVYANLIDRPLAINIVSSAHDNVSLPRKTVLLFLGKF